MSDQQLGADFKVARGDQVLMAMPRIAVVRVILLNHLYHHRGQVALCLRMLGQKVPATYGNSADENPFA
jgi:uncharacterized damage-inducible protein DinB